jgi:hypothetical protein
MIGLRRTYREVARELSEGLQSGQISLDEEPTMDEMGLLAGLVFQYFAPKKVAFVLGATGSAGIVGANPQIMIQIDPKDYENLPNEAKVHFSMKTQELTDKGVKIKFKDLHGNTFFFLDHATAKVTPAAHNAPLNIGKS